MSRNMEPRSNQCMAIGDDGNLCLDQAYCFDPELGALVCREHAPFRVRWQLYAREVHQRVVECRPQVREPEFAST